MWMKHVLTFLWYYPGIYPVLIKFSWPRSDIHLHDLWFAVTFDYDIVSIDWGLLWTLNGKYGKYGGISFLAHDVWNLVPPFFLYIFLMRDLVPWCMESRSIIFLYIIFPYIIFPYIIFPYGTFSNIPFLFFLSYTLLPLYVYILYFHYVSKVPDYMCGTT